MPTREELELRKLELEVRDLARPPWMRAVYIAALLPAMLALLTFVSAWMSGYFDRERLRLKEETVQLRAGRDALQAERAKLQGSVEALVTELRETTNQYNEFYQRIREAVYGTPTVTPSPSGAGGR